MSKSNQKPNHSWRYKLKNIVFYLILFLIILTGLTVWFTDTPLGFKTLVNLSEPLLSKYGVVIQGPVNGILTNFKIQKIQINSLTLENFSLQVQPRNLLLGQINLSQASGILQINDFSTPIKLFGQISLRSPHTFNLHGWVLLKRTVIPTPKSLFKTNFQIAGDLSHYQFTAHGQGVLFNRQSHLIIQGFGSSAELHTEELVLELPHGSIDGSVTITNFSPLTLKLQLNGHDIPAQDPAFNPNQLLNFALNFSTNSQTQEANLTLHAPHFDTQLHATRVINNGVTQLDPILLTTSNGHWQLPSTQLVLQNTLINIPHACFTYQSKQSIHTASSSAQNQSQNQICGQLFFQNKNQSSDLISDLQINLKDLSVLQDFSDKTNDLEGVLTGSMHIEGPPSQLKYTGSIQLSQGRLGLPEWGIVFQKITLLMQSQDEPFVHIQGSAESGSGTLTWKGSLSDQNNQLNLGLGIDGDHLTLINLPLAYVIASPHLVYTQNAQTMALTGVVNLNEAHINADEYKNFPASESKDVVFVDNQNRVIQNQDSLPFALNLILMTDPKKNNIQFEGFGIKTGVTGQLTVSSFANKPTLADGQLSLINGQYQAYGKHFNITQGSLIFNHSPITNPTLNISATYVMTSIVLGGNSVGSIVVGVKVTGTISQIHLSLFSDPPMSQENILSYIITGQPLSQAGPGSQSALSQAALSFATAGGDQSAISKIQETFKLNQLSVGSLNGLPTNNLAAGRETNGPNQDNTAVFVGKSITSRFYVSYGVGLFNNEQILMTHFTLSPHFYIQTDNSTLDAGADVFYTFEH